MNNINDLQEQFENLIKQSQELLEKMKENHITDTSKKGRWKPKDGETYFFILTDGDIVRHIWRNDIVDDYGFKLGNCFKTKEEAQKELNRRFAEQELLDMCDWKCGLPRYEIDFDVNSDIFLVFGALGSLISSPYRFASEESCQKALDTIGEDKLKLIFRID